MESVNCYWQSSTISFKAKSCTTTEIQCQESNFQAIWAVGKMNPSRSNFYEHSSILSSIYINGSYFWILLKLRQYPSKWRHSSPAEHVCLIILKFTAQREKEKTRKNIAKKKKRSKRGNQSWDGLFESVYYTENVKHVIEK